MRQLQQFRQGNGGRVGKRGPEMKWQNIVIEELEHHYSKINSLENIKSKIENLECKKSSLKGAQRMTEYHAPDQAELTGKTTLLNTITEIDRLKATYRQNKRDVERISKSLAKLTPQEYKIIEGFFLSKRKNNAYELSRELKYEKSHIYNLKEWAH